MQSANAREQKMEAPEQKTYGYTWRHCERPDLARATIPFDKKDRFRPDCAPDVLYSWQSHDKVVELRNAAMKNPRNIFPVPYMYMWRTPMGTFGYNTDLIRVKLKKGVRFAYLHSAQRQCPINPAQDQNTVYVSYLGHTNHLPGWTEYILCSGGPVASWSHDTPEGLSEMLAEEKWVSTHGPRDYDSIYRIGMGGSSDCANCALFRMNITDPHTDWTKNRLTQDFKWIYLNLQKHPEGEIFYAPGIAKDRQAHFATKLPGYFNSVPEQSEQQ
jgi:hypothetical protein